MEQKQSDALEQFCILAKGAKGKACEALIEQALSNPQIYFFGELLDIPSIKELQNTPFYRTLLLFAFGSIEQYQANKQDYVNLTENQLRKLKQLTLVQEASKQKVLQYSNLQQQLGLHSIRELEDLIIDTMYLGLITGRLDQKNQQFKISYVQGREIEENKLPEIRQKLVSWIDKLNSVEKVIQTQIQQSIESKEMQNCQNQLLQKQINEIQEQILKSFTQGENSGLNITGMGMGSKRKKNEEARAQQFLGGGFQSSFYRK